ncbi:MAG: ABC transporter ATP-binding protein [Lentisphaerae bacterium]|nr:ABC transporter ATP-binding protein [Lentisphaerota bacterium]
MTATGGAGGVVVEAGGLTKRYEMGRKTIEVLRGASLSVRRGEALAVIGASGAGKSTLLHILGALDHPDEGWVRIGGELVGTLSSRRRAAIRAGVIGFVFQSYHLMPEMDVTENVMLPSMAFNGGLRWKAARRRAAELLEQVGLGGRANHMPFELSGGEQQRVALARALMNDPEVILADEPTGNLDDETGGAVLENLFMLSRDRGRALIVVTHSETVAASCHRRTRLADGVLHAVE